MVKPIICGLPHHFINSKATVHSRGFDVYIQNFIDLCVRNDSLSEMGEGGG